MENNWVGMLIVAVVAFSILGISAYRKRRIDPQLETFAQAYCEAADHVLGGPHRMEGAWLATETTADGLLRLAPLDQQPEALRQLLQQGVDDYVMERLGVMHAARCKAQETLSGINFFSKRINPIVNTTYDQINEFLTLVLHPDVVFDQKNLDQFHYFLHQQGHIRNVALGSVLPEHAKQKIAC